MTAGDGTRHWVFGASMDAYSIDLPMTFAYWTGAWNGTAFIADNLTPQWLDWGWDWYAAVTWPSVEAPETKRLATAWMNNWKYAARDVPTDASDGYNGQNSITRELRLERQSGGWYSLISSPVEALQGYVTATTTLPDRTVNGSVVLPWSGRAYELELDISWNVATNVGVSVGRSPDGSRHTNIGKYGDELYVDRAPSDQGGYALAPYTRAAAPIDANAQSVHLRIFVDTQSVEVFVNSGHTVISQQVHFADGDTGVSLYADGGAGELHRNHHPGVWQSSVAGRARARRRVAECGRGARSGLSGWMAGTGGRHVAPPLGGGGSAPWACAPLLRARRGAGPAAGWCLRARQPRR